MAKIFIICRNYALLPPAISQRSITFKTNYRTILLDILRSVERIVDILFKFLPLFFFITFFLFLVKSFFFIWCQ